MMASGENLVNEERSMNKEPSSPCACSGGNGQQTACASEQASTETTVFHVSNMDCRNEEALVRRTLEGMPGVERLLFDLPQRLLTISHREVSADALEQALNSVGMKAQAVRDAAVSTTYRIENMDCPSEEKLIRSHLGAVEGIQDLDFDLAERTLSVKHLAQARAQMEQVLASIGMRAKEQTFGHTGPIEAAAVIPSSALQQQPTAAVSAPPIGERVTYRIENMDCPTEEALIRDRLGKLPGVTALDFNLMQRVLGVQHTLATSAPIEKALASIGMQAARQDMQTATTVLRIAKMDCPTEESLIRGKLQGMPGVQGMDFNLMQRTLTVRHTPDAIKPAVEAIESLGMEAEVQRTDEPRDAPVAAHKTNWWPMAVSTTSRRQVPVQCEAVSSSWALASASSLLWKRSSAAGPPSALRVCTAIDCTTASVFFTRWLSSSSSSWRCRSCCRRTSTSVVAPTHSCTRPSSPRTGTTRAASQW